MLRPAIEDYLALRRSLGFKLSQHERLLGSFAAFAATRAESFVRSATAVEWAAMATSPVERDWRLSVLQRFALHARADNLEYEVPPLRIFGGSKRRPTPFIFAPEEIRRLLAATATLRPTGSRRAPTYRMLFGLLACAGLRISEALGLQLDDVTEDGLVIRKTKFRKSRIVPLHESSSTRLHHYITRERCLGGPCVDDHLFVSARGRGYCYAAVRSTFSSLLRKIGLDPAHREPRPRLHSFRHTFAVRALERCPAGRDRDLIEREMLALSTYLGHGRLSDTYWYLEATPQLMVDIADACAVFEEKASKS